MRKFLFTLLAAIIYASTPNLAEHSLEVYGNASLGYYYVKIFVGNPPQEQTVIIDTGSGQLALPCNKCKKCSQHHINTPFDMGKSKTAEYVTCQSNDSQCKRCANRVPTQSCTFSISYAEGSSLEGIIIRDSIQFQSFTEGEQITASFGCTTKETNLFLKQEANGIFGLAPQRTSNLLEELYRRHHSFSGEQLEFSLCLSGNGGKMVLGGVNKQLISNQQPVKIGFSTHRNLYSLNEVKQVSMGNVVIHSQNQKFGYYGIFVDSGSTFTYFPRQKYQSFKNQLIRKCHIFQLECEVAEGESTLCFHLKGAQEIPTLISRIFDPIIIEGPGFSLDWQPEKYFLLRDKINRQVCLGVQALDRYLLGANWMIDRNVVFNLEEKNLLVYNNVDCGKKGKSVREMSQYTNKVQGHEPLTYKSSNRFISSLNTSLKLTFGVILTFFGVLGLALVLLRRKERRREEKHTRVSPIQTEQNIQEINN